MSLKWVSARHVAGGAAVGLALLAVPACASTSASTTSSGGACKPAKSPVITLAAYSTPYDAYGKLISTWQKEWAAAHNKQQVIFQTSFGGSTAQAENVASGFPADIVALSLVPDVQIVQKAGLITHDFTKDPNGSIVSTTPVAFDVRPGNPKHIRNWNDLTRPGLQILTPDPAQSGGAKWNIVAADGASMRGKVPGYAANSQSSAQKLLTGIFKNVTVMDKSANDSLKNFQSGNGDVAITYENQILLSKAGGSSDQEVLPPSTVLIQNPTVVVDKNAQKHCVLPIANAFVKWLHTPEAQAIFQQVGFFRPISPAQAKQGDKKLGQAPVTDLFTTNDIGGWNQLITSTVFGPNGAFTQAFKAAKG
jgi:sulfate/thiosulfate transport system substrate-binding protein